MKKFVLLVLALAAGYVIWRKVSEDSAERDLWAEVTESFE
ncbi:MAG: DLW-39 family protein [Cellulomonadaceae bacterium]